MDALNFGGSNPRQPPPIDSFEVIVPLNSTPVPTSICCYSRHNDYNGYKVKVEIHVFNRSLNNDDREYVGDEEENEEYIDEVCGKEQGDLVFIVQKISYSFKQEELTL